MDWHGTATIEGKREKWMKFAQARNRELGCFLQLDPEIGREASSGDGPLAGIPFGVKDNIAVRSFRLTCGSRMLQSFVSPYSATAIERLQKAGAIVAGKTNLDEFGMGSSTENSALLETRNPWDLRRVPGGSSGGSAAAVAAGIVPFALGSDTGGSVRQPASFCGVYGLKPTWGAVSRYGLVAYASSLEVIGVVAKTVDAADQAFTIMRGQDPMDHSSLPWPSRAPQGGRLRIGVPRECAEVPMHTDVKKTLTRTQDMLRDMGHTVEEVSFQTFDHVVSSYYVIATAEASANLARFDGVRYGHRTASADNPEEMTLLSRNEGFGDEVKLRILLGTYVLRSGFQDEYYLRAQKIRTAIRRDFEKAFSELDLVLMPVYPVPPFERGGSDSDSFSQKLADIFTCSANLAGLPAMSFPAGKENGLPIGMQFLAPAFAEELLIDACRQVESVFPSPDAPGYPKSWS
ncbi:MAG TPA: Asp-tRNA(Asn)/Glu-tRNA(Gln) amidotransferase subunit GatA [Spirochaetia bacterium]|nr:Asp-tRNA(Asn)/Glu-tRNA(Gln) amidotransferase subunit GatA [Spirochaetia bacterium]